MPPASNLNSPLTCTYRDHIASGDFYDVANLAPPYQLQETNIHPANLNMLGGISNGLTAPLPTSYLCSSYVQSCGSSIIVLDDSLKPQNSDTSDESTGDTAAEPTGAILLGISVSAGTSLGNYWPATAAAPIFDFLQGLVASQLAIKMVDDQNTSPFWSAMTSPSAN